MTTRSLVRDRGRHRPGSREKKEARVPDRVLLDEFHLTLTVPRATPDPAREAARRAANGRRFRAELRRAVRAALARYPALARVRAALTA
jgi:hypothetical protein